RRDGGSVAKVRSRGSLEHGPGRRGPESTPRRLARGSHGVIGAERTRGCEGLPYVWHREEPGGVRQEVEREGWSTVPLSSLPSRGRSRSRACRGAGRVQQPHLSELLHAGAQTPVRRRSLPCIWAVPALHPVH